MSLDSPTDTSFIELIKAARKAVEEEAKKPILRPSASAVDIMRMDNIISAHETLQKMLTDLQNIEYITAENVSGVLKQLETFKKTLAQLRSIHNEFITPELTAKKEEISKELKTLEDQCKNFVTAAKIPERLQNLEKEIDQHMRKPEQSQYTWEHRQQRLEKTQEFKKKNYDICKTLLKCLYVSMAFALPLLVITIPIAIKLNKEVEGLKKTADNCGSSLQSLSDIKKDIDLISKDSEQKPDINNVQSFQASINKQADKLNEVAQTMKSTLGVEAKQIPKANV